MHYQLIVSLLVPLALIISCAEPVKQPTGIDSSQQPPDIERGRYVIEIMGCNDCHTPGYMKRTSDIPEEDWLVGGTLGFRGPYGTVYPTNLRLMLKEITEDEWLTLARRMRKGSPMAWVMLPKTSELDLRAIYQFVTHLGAKGSPAPERLPPGVTPSTPFVDYPDPH